MSIEIEEKIRLINDRIGWKLTRSLLGGEHGITAQGLDPFIMRFTEAADGNDELSDSIDTFWDNLIFSGNRLLRIFRVQDEELSRIHESLLGLTPDESSFNINYPSPISNDELNAADMSMHFAENRQFIIKEKQVFASVILSKAYYTQTFELESSHLSDAGLQLRANGGEIKCKKRMVTQCYNNIIILPASNLVITAVDLSTLPISDAEAQQNRLEHFIQDTTTVALRNPINLFPAINSMYSARDGRISAVTFLTSDGNSSSLKLTPTQRCLREDSYHHGGEIASPVLTKYKLGKIWDIRYEQDRNVSIELTLPGKRAMLDNPNKALINAVANNSPSLGCLLLIINNLMNSLPTPEVQPED
ncbi:MULTISPECIES: hypothetical protein [Yersinia]|uniref:hypothetical protein n=1 Tax=Yersinia TaxID=629 RepID=UPI0025AA36D2|nr:hypothetical protein [Yersinia mollaretii]EKN5029786.1 hypothetical protein [Yersinia enterocolitica]MDN0109611.1 hypothetical protein [Yersinia mollaretii]HDL7594798.1 hypothetical protein [Yersinia enterocolitica]HEN3477578.1 hypothetical protein [Yersinia enterocolitica]HEN3478330.1 hypothetical protein [Yersinia enterocolitica]